MTICYIKQYRKQSGAVLHYCDGPARYHCLDLLIIIEVGLYIAFMLTNVIWGIFMLPLKFIATAHSSQKGCFSDRVKTKHE